jgi:hypothetical protein
MLMLILGSITDKMTWSPTINALVEKGTVDVMPYDLVLDYEYWSYGMKLHVCDTCAW